MSKNFRNRPFRSIQNCFMRLSALSFCLSALFFGCLFNQTQAQSTRDKDSLVNRGVAYSNTLEFYHQYLAPESGLYRGSQYADYAYLIKDGHPFFDDGHMQKGSVFYDGILYGDLDLVYDLVNEQVVINDPYNIYKISLINEQVDRFTIGSHPFIHLRDSLNASAPRVGFYEELCQGRTTLLKREKKVVQEDLTSGEIRRFIIHTTSYYLKKGQTYYAVNNKRSLLHALNDQSGEVKKFIRKNDLSMRRDEENTLIKVSAWYNNKVANAVNQ